MQEFDIADIRTLAMRRPGHAAMTRLLRELDRRRGGDLVPPDLRSWYLRAVGEVVVGQELARLGDEWAVLHAVPIDGDGGVAHLLIGPPGVLVVRTERHPGRAVRVGAHVVRIDAAQRSGWQQDLLARAEQVGASLRSVGIVRPLLVFVDAQRLTRSGSQSVEALTAGELVEHLQALPPVLGPDEVRAISGRAADPSTWGCAPQVLDEPDPTARFLALRDAAADPAPTVLERSSPTAQRLSARACESVSTPPPGLGRLLARAFAVSAAVVLMPITAAAVVLWSAAIAAVLLGR